MLLFSNLFVFVWFGFSEYTYVYESYIEILQQSLANNSTIQSPCFSFKISLKNYLSLNFLNGVLVHWQMLTSLYLC